jgi:hypothetical protein
VIKRREIGECVGVIRSPFPLANAPNLLDHRPQAVGALTNYILDQSVLGFAQHEFQATH